MSPNLEAQLLRNYPSLLRPPLEPERDLMKWGFACDDVWYPILDALCACISWHVEQDDMPPVEVLQIKEKFGELRFRFRGGDARTHALVDLARRLSANVSESNRCSDASFGSVR